MNKLGLDRYIPEDVKRQVRIRSKFGCVFCGDLICEYEHIDPPFADARAHDPEKICLLCPTHHSNVTKGLISKAMVQTAYQARHNNPDARPPHFSAVLGADVGKLILGNASFEHVPDGASIIQVNDTSLLRLAYEQSEELGGLVPQISGTLYDDKGRQVLTIDRNTIEFSDGRYDIQSKGRKISVYDRPRRVGVEIEITPPATFTIRRLRMLYGDVEFLFNRTFSARVPHMNGSVVEVHAPELVAKGMTSAVRYSSSQMWSPSTTLSIVGGQGIRVGGTGLTFAEGAGSMSVQKMYVLSEHN